MNQSSLRRLACSAFLSSSGASLASVAFADNQHSSNGERNKRKDGGVSVSQLFPPMLTPNTKLIVDPYPGYEELCPKHIHVWEDVRPVEEGLEHVGFAPLDWLAHPFTWYSSDEKSVTWYANLKAQYALCWGTAQIQSPQEGYIGGHLSMFLGGGKVYFTLDVGGIPAEAKITYHETDAASMPVWRWALKF